MVRVHMGTTVVVVCMTELFVSLPLSVVLTLCILSTVFPSLAPTELYRLHVSNGALECGAFAVRACRSVTLAASLRTPSIHIPALGALIGAWLGVLPIPLDWDRPWQAWPIPCVVGAIVGCAVASLLAACGQKRTIQQEGGHVS